MRLDQKYFIPFLAVAAVVTALLITFFTISSQKGQRQAFRDRIMQQDSLKTEAMPVLNGTDSLRVDHLRGSYVILDFWATWSNFSEEVHQDLANLAAEYDSLKVIAAVVQDQPEKIDGYLARHDFPFYFVKGTKVFAEYGVPGLPTDILYNPQGEIERVYFGYTDTTHFHSLRKLLRDGK